MLKENVNHPNHYGGAENTYEAIKVIEAWELDNSLGNIITEEKHDSIADEILSKLSQHDVSGRSEQLVCDCPDEKLWDIEGKIVCECGKYYESKAN
jgi:hypothetical protein